MSGAKADIFAALRCPQTGGPLRLDVFDVDAGGAPRTGLLIGAQHDYPLILGIPRLIADARRAPLVALIRQGVYDAAADLALSWPDKNPSNRVRRKLSSLILKAGGGRAAAGRLAARVDTGQLVRAPHASVEALLRDIQSGFFVDWLLHRFSARTFRPLMTLSRLLRPDDLVLDVGGGFGHGAWVMSGRVPAHRIVMMDAVFAHLHVARTRMVPCAVCIAADVNAGVPLDGVAFDSVVMSDTFHFVTAQRRLAEDVQRLLSPKGRLILSQLHNGLIKDDFTGAARSPQSYLDLFGDMQATLVRNDSLLEVLRTRSALELSPKVEMERIEPVAEISLVADRTGDVMASHAAPMADMRNPVLASILRPDAQGRLATRTDIAPVVSPFIDWPSEADLDGLNAADIAGAQGEDAERLLRTGLLVSVPPGYLSSAG